MVISDTEKKMQKSRIGSVEIRKRAALFIYFFNKKKVKKDLGK